MATGSLLNLTDAVITGRVKNGFALIRPPGHHAEPGIMLARNLTKRQMERWDFVSTTMSELLPNGLCRSFQSK